MNSDYESIIRSICGEDWASQNKSADERDGGYGVAMVLSFLRGIPPKLPDLSKDIGVPHFVLEVPYKRLQINGIFSKRSWVHNEPLLKGSNTSSKESEKKLLLLWCHIAAISSGFLGKGLTREEMAVKGGET